MRTKLRGSSGISIFLKNQSGEKIVRKQTAKKAQIERLKIQYKKHLFLLKKKNTLFNIPPIINHGTKENIFFYEYKYIEGITMSEALSSKSYEQLTKILTKLFLIVKYFSKNNDFFETFYKKISFNKVLKDKIFNICDSLTLEKSIRNKFLSKLKYINIQTNKTLYHGDLSFDNIILDKKDNIWLIDCIGTFYPHYWTDLSKLFQDIEGEWFQLKHGIKLDKEKNRKLTNYLKEKISKFDKNYLKHHNFFMAVIFLRILPYLKNKSKKEKVLEKIIKYLN